MRRSIIVLSLAIVIYSLVATAQSISGSAPLIVSNNIVNWNTTFQTIDGFGGAVKGGSQALTSAMANLVFGTGAGQAGFTIYRMDGCEDTACTTDSLASAQLAAGLGASTLVTWWSPPAVWKDNGSIIEGSLLTSNYANFATLITSQINILKTNGVTVLAVSPANEPDASVTYDSAVWTDTQLANFLGNNLCSALSGTGVSVYMPESQAWDGGQALADTTVATPAANACVKAYADHDYDGALDAQSWVPSNKHLWMTEVSVFNPTDTSMTSALNYAQNIHTMLTVANVNAWIWWEISWTGSDNEGLIYNGGNTVTKRLFAIGNWAKFVRPGMIRMNTTSNFGGVQISAFKNSSTGAFAIVAVNSNSGATPISMNFSGFSSSQLTPHVTDVNNNLADLTAISAGSSFSYTLSGNSVTTFTGTNGS